jgi:hypothetical protein
MIRHFISYFLPFVVYLVLYSSFNLPSKAEWLLYISPALTCHNSEFYTEACLSLPYRNKNDCFPKQHYWVDIHVFPMRYELNFYILFEYINVMFCKTIYSDRKVTQHGQIFGHAVFIQFWISSWLGYQLRCCYQCKQNENCLCISWMRHVARMRGMRNS